MKITSKQMNEIFKIDPQLRDFYHNNFCFKNFCNLSMGGNGNPDINVLALLHDLLCRIEKLQAEIEDLKKDKPLQYVFNAPDKEAMMKLIELVDEANRREEREGG